MRRDRFEEALLGMPPRFADAGRHVWRALPPDVREDLRWCWWRLSRPPRIFLEDGPLVGGRPALGCYRVDLSIFVFDRRAVERMSEAALRALIAHELCHGHRDMMGLEHLDPEADEEATAATCRRWGFGWRPEYDPAFRGPGRGEVANS